MKRILLGVALVIPLVAQGASVAELKNSSKAKAYDQVENNSGANASNPGFVTNSKGGDYSPKIKDSQITSLPAHKITGNINGNKIVGSIDNVSLGRGVTGQPRLDISRTYGSNTTIRSETTRTVDSKPAGSSLGKWVYAGGHQAGPKWPNPSTSPLGQVCNKGVDGYTYHPTIRQTVEKVCEPKIGGGHDGSSGGYVCHDEVRHSVNQSTYRCI